MGNFPREDFHCTSFFYPGAQIIFFFLLNIATDIQILPGSTEIP